MPVLWLARLLYTLSVNSACLPAAYPQRYKNFAASVLPGIQIRFCIPVFPAGIHRDTEPAKCHPQKDGNLTGDISPSSSCPAGFEPATSWFVVKRPMVYERCREFVDDLSAVGWGRLICPRVVSISESCWTAGIQEGYNRRVAKP